MGHWKNISKNIIINLLTISHSKYIWKNIIINMLTMGNSRRIKKCNFFLSCIKTKQIASNMEILINKIIWHVFYTQFYSLKTINNCAGATLRIFQ